MAPLVIISQTVIEIYFILSTLADIGILFSNIKTREEILAYEKLRLNAISRHKRKIGRCVMHKNPEQRSTVLPGTRCVLHVQSRKHDAGKHTHTRSGKHPS